MAIKHRRKTAEEIINKQERAARSVSISQPAAITGAQAGLAAGMVKPATVRSQAAEKIAEAYGPQLDRQLPQPAQRLPQPAQ